MQSRIFNSQTLPRHLLAMGMDVLCAWASLWLAISLRLDVWQPPYWGQIYAYALAPLIALPVMVKWGLYRAIFRYTGFAAMLATLQAIAVYGLIFGIYVVFFSNPTHVPRSVGALQPMIFLLLVGGNRALIRALFQYDRKAVRQQGRLLIYGAGETGVQTAAAILNARQYTLIGYIDSDPQKVGRSINGFEIWSDRDLARVVQASAVSDVLLAIPSLTRAERNAIIQNMRGLSVHVRSVPSMAELASGQAAVQHFQELDVEDLLGRDPVAPVAPLIARNIRNQAVLVTGAGGSIGSELCRQIIQHAPSRLLLVEHSEFALYQIAQDLQALAASQPQPPEVVALLGDVRDLQRMRQIIAAYQPSTIYHAAAYKHVPMVEHNAVQGLANNVFGTLTVARAALEHAVPHMVLVSTDKAVRPTNLMGASKRLAEMALQALAASAEADFSALDACSPAGAATQAPLPRRTCFAMVRFGNVLGSSGSVVPLFRQQIAHGGPITLTHAEVTRYFMTIPEAAQLVLQAGAMAQGGEVFVLDMGEPVKIIDLARHMVMLSGLTVRDADCPHGDIALHITGLRPGEKLYEELLIGDNPQPTQHPRIMMAQEAFVPWPQLQQHLAALLRLMQANQIEAIDALLLQLVSGFQAGPVVDHIALQKKSTSVQQAIKMG